MAGIIWPWERKKVQRELDSVEDMLESMFQPVAARPSFTADLRKRLVGKPGPLAKAGLGTLELVLLIGGSIVGTVVFIFTIVRSIIGLVTGIRLLGDRRKRRPAPKATTKKRPA
jgi:hypothetical protein